MSKNIESQRDVEIYMSAYIDVCVCVSSNGGIPAVCKETK